MTECIVCRDGFKDPRILPCGHTFCRLCLQHMINQNDSMCPTCKKTFVAPNRDSGKLQRNYTLEQALLRDSSGSRSEKQDEKCAEHRKKFTLFCYTCRQLVCSDCSSAKHNRHTLLNMRDAEGKAEELLTEIVRQSNVLVEVASEYKSSCGSNPTADNQEQIIDLATKFDRVIKMLQTAKEKVLLAAQSTAHAISDQEATEEKRDLFRQVSAFYDYIEDLRNAELGKKLRDLNAAEATLKELQKSFDSLSRENNHPQSSQATFSVDEQLKSDIVAVCESAERLLVKAEDNKYTFASYVHVLEAAEARPAASRLENSSRSHVSFNEDSDDVQVLVCIGGCYLIKKAVLAAPNGKRWLSVSNMKRGRHDAAAAAWNGKVVVCGGSQTYNSVEMFDPVRNEWTEQSILLTGRSEHALVNLHGVLYTVGGISASKDRLDSVERYNPDDELWEQSAPLLVPRKQFGAAVLQVGSRKAVILVAGGSIEVDGATDLCEVFSNVSKTWTTVDSMKCARKCFAAAAYERTAFVFGGIDNKDHELNTVEQFDGLTLKWTGVHEKMSVARSSFSVATVNGLIYVVGGCSERHWLDLVECFDPVRTRFSSTTSLPQALCCHAVACLSVSSSVINRLG